MNQFILILTTVILIFAPYRVHSWWDNIHMSIGKIAESQLEQWEVDKLNTFLGIWKHNYPAMSDIITSTIFPDHLRCQKYNPECEGLPFLDHFTLFNNSHSTFIPYNPLNLTEEFVMKPRKGSQEGIQNLLNSLKRFMITMEKYPCTTKSCDIQIGSDFSWSLTLRLFLHMYGDIHVPCHCCNGMSEFYPDGDDLGLRVKLAWPIFSGGDLPRDEFNNLHSYMDSVGNRYYNNYPRISMPEIENLSKLFASKNPFNHFNETVQNVDPWDIDTITQESYEIQVHIYELLDFVNYNPKDGKLVISPENEKKIQALLEQRVALAGYRLGKALKRLSHAFPDPKANIHSVLNPNSRNFYI